MLRYSYYLVAPTWLGIKSNPRPGSANFSGCFISACGLGFVCSDSVVCMVLTAGPGRVRVPAAVVWEIRCGFGEQLQQCGVK